MNDTSSEGIDHMAILGGILLVIFLTNSWLNGASLTTVVFAFLCYPAVIVVLDRILGVRDAE